MVISEEFFTYDLSDTELQEGIDGLNDVLDKLMNYEDKIEEVNYTVSKYEAEEIADKLFDIVDVPYLSNYIDDIELILGNLGYYNTNTKEIVRIIHRIEDVVVRFLRQLEEELNYRK